MQLIMEQGVGWVSLPDIKAWLFFGNFVIHSMNEQSLLL